MKEAGMPDAPIERLNEAASITAGRLSARQFMAHLERVARGRVGERYRRLRRHRNYRFLIYASARTGSSSLGQALNNYLGIQCAMEPFNPDWPGNVRERVSDLPSLKREVRRLWRCHNGFKHVWHPNGFPFKGQPEFNDYLHNAGD